MHFNLSYYVMFFSVDIFKVTNIASASFIQPLEANNELLQELEIRRPQPSHWVPPNRRIPSRVRDDSAPWDRSASLAINPITTDRRATRDIVERSPANGVEPWVDEA